jgi:hypothetical protein
MKKIFFIALMIVSFGANTQVNFGIGIFQNFGNVYADNGTYSAEKFNMNPSSTGISIFFGKELRTEGWYSEFKADISILGDTSILVNSDAYSPILAEIDDSYTTDIIEKTYDYNIAAYKTSHQLVQFILNRKVSKYFSLGGGIAMDIRKSNYDDLNGIVRYQWNTNSSTYLYASDNNLSVNSYSKNSVNLMIPINFRFHLPVKKMEFIFSNSFMLANNNHSYFQSNLMFQF